MKIHFAVLLCFVAGFQLCAQTPADSKDEIANLRAEVARLHVELDAAVKEIDKLKEALRQPGKAQDAGQLYRGKPAGFWLEQLKDADSEFRASAVSAIGTLVEYDKTLLPTLVGALKDKSKDVGEKAASYLGWRGQPKAIPLILDVLKGSDSPLVRANAATALSNMKAKPKAAVPILTEALKSTKGPEKGEWRDARSPIVKLLGEIGPDAKLALPVLVDTLGSYLQSVDVEVVGMAKPRFQLGGDSLLVASRTAIVQIDPEAGKILPPDPKVTGQDYTAWVEAHAALKKKYAAEKD